jgi:predicted alpha/beta hydrolase
VKSHSTCTAKNVKKERTGIGIYDLDAVIGCVARWTTSTPLEAIVALVFASLVTDIRVSRGRPPPVMGVGVPAPNRTPSHLMRMWRRSTNPRK